MMGCFRLQQIKIVIGTENFEIMKGYIYTLYKGADPGMGFELTDPVFGKVPTLGACMPNIRRLVEKGDFIFAISGKHPKVSQYVVGGFEVNKKLDALSAYYELPENRLIKKADGSFSGNIIVDENGNQLPYDTHSNFSKRTENYIIGKKPIVVEKENEIEKARLETVSALNSVFHQEGETVFDIVGRWRKMNEKQVEEMIYFLESFKRA